MLLLLNPIKTLLKKKIDLFINSDYFKQILNYGPNYYSQRNWEQVKAYLIELQPLQIFNDLIDLIPTLPEKIVELLTLLKKLKIFSRKHTLHETITINGIIFNRQQIKKKFQNKVNIHRTKLLNDDAYDDFNKQV